MAPRAITEVAQLKRPPRQIKAGVPPGRGAIDGSGQPPFIPTDQQRIEVRRMVAIGFTVDSISVIMTIPKATLERHFPFELQHGKLMTDARILGGIVSMAEEGDKTMSIFWAKARAGWRDMGKDVDGGGNASFTINISNGSATNGGVPPEDDSHTITIHSFPQPEEEP